MVEEQHRFPCPSCGADMRFDPGQNRLICDFCGHTEVVEKGVAKYAEPIRELDFEAALSENLLPHEIEEVRISPCPNCGAQIEIHEKDHATTCPFCATPVVTDTGTHRQIKPQGLLPFLLDEPQAHAAMNKWMGRLWFAPSGLTDYARKGRKMNGVYVPFWTYDADTRTKYSGQRGDDYYTTETRMVDGKQETYQEKHTRWTHASGRVKRFFDDVLILASNSLPRKHTDALEPWELKSLKPYDPNFLAGFNAEGYQIQLDEGFENAKKVMERQIRRDIERDIGGDHQRISSMDTVHSDITFKHVLLPIWLAAYRYKGKSYRFVVNGQTGKVKGERPYSAIKIAFAVIVVALIVGGIAYYAEYMQ